MSRTANMAGRGAGPLLHGALMNGRVVVALIFREAGIRFGGGPISYLWTLVEPALLVSFVLFMRSYVRQYSAAFGDSSLLFLMTGFLTFRMVRQTANSAGRAIAANQLLFDMGVIKPPDVVIARTVVEFTIWLIIFVAFFFAIQYIINEQVITNFQGFVLALLSIFYFCLAMSMLNATMFALLPVWRSIWKLMTLPLLFISGVIYVPSSMPPEVQMIIIWNPVLHCIEGIRAASYLDYISLYDPIYLNSLSTTILLVALFIERIYRRDIIRADVEKFDDDEDVF